VDQLKIKQAEDKKQKNPGNCPDNDPDSCHIFILAILRINGRVKAVYSEPKDEMRKNIPTGTKLPDKLRLKKLEIFCSNAIIKTRNTRVTLSDIRG
jgi:hypothetical protein